jgi:hypothetical protein
MDARAGNGLRPYPGLRKPVCLLAQMKTAVSRLVSVIRLVQTLFGLGDLGVRCGIDRFPPADV